MTFAVGRMYFGPVMLTENFGSTLKKSKFESSNLALLFISSVWLCELLVRWQKANVRNRLNTTYQDAYMTGVWAVGYHHTIQRSRGVKSMATELKIQLVQNQNYWGQGLFKQQCNFRCSFVSRVHAQLEILRFTWEKFQP